MKSKKHTGSYYTPDYLSEFMVRYIAEQYNGAENLSALEPSVGDGSFARAFNNCIFPNTIKKFKFTALEKIKPELKKAQASALSNKKKHTKYAFTRADFLGFQKGLHQKYHLIAGNPPYIKKNFLNKTQVELCAEIHKSANLSPSSVKNIWSAFLVRCCQLLTEDGILAFVLPAELLQVKFSAELRTFLTSIFQRIEIFTFDDLLFECKGQDTILLFGYKRHRQPGQFYTHITDATNLENREFTLVQNHALITTDTKWTHHLLSSDELTFIYNIGKRLDNINHYCDSKPGIVTAANSFFIVNEETELKHSLGDYSKPIIQKGLYVNGSVVFNERDFKNLVAEGKPTKVLVFKDAEVGGLPNYVGEYLELGKELNLPDRYKCTKRKNWFVIPNISTVPEGFFFKRSHHYPKLLKNNANVLVTDSAYKIEMRKGYNINHLVYSFYNSLTLTLAELYGRYYGGGVLELTPQEFKKVPIPNIQISGREFNAYTKQFEGKNDIGEILDNNDLHILHTALNLNAEEIGRIRGIYDKLISKRFRKKAT